MWPFRYFPSRYWPNRYWARITGAVDPNALHGATHGLASASAILRGLGTLTGTVQGSSATSGTLIDGAGVVVLPVSAGGWGGSYRFTPGVKTGGLAGTIQGSSATRGHLTGLRSATPIQGFATGSVTVSGALIGRVTRGVLAARAIGKAIPVAHGRIVEDDEMLFLLLAA